MWPLGAHDSIGLQLPALLPWLSWEADVPSSLPRIEEGGSPLMLSRCVKKKDCLWKSSMARTMGPSRLLLRVFLEPLLSAMSDSSMVRTMYSLERKGQKVRWPSTLRDKLPSLPTFLFFLLLLKRTVLRKHRLRQRSGFGATETWALPAVLGPSTCQASIHHWACHLPL